MSLIFLRAIQTSAHLRLPIRPPLFELMEPNHTKLYEAFFDRFEHYGLRLSDIKLQRATEDLASARALFVLRQPPVLIDVSLGEINIRFETLQPDVDLVATILSDAIGALRNLREAIRTLGFEVQIAMHARPEEVAPLDIVRSIISDRSSHVAGMVSASLSMELDSEASHQGMDILIEPSIAISDGLFVRMRAKLNEDVVESSDIVSTSRLLFIDFLQRFGMALSSDDTVR